MKNIVIILNILLLFEFIISDCDIEDAEPSDCANITLKDYEKKKDHVGYVPDTCCYIHHIDRDYSMGFSEESVKECIPMKKLLDKIKLLIVSMIIKSFIMVLKILNVKALLLHLLL